MASVFISSVVRGFEGFRNAARRAVELTGHQPIMSENFGARPHSSEIACITEVQRCDVYVLVLGAGYGYIPDGDDLSVTHAEYRAAKASNKPVLVFVQDIEMEDAQAAFKQEVENYQSGEFREGFSTEEELKDGIVQALSHLQRGIEAIPVNAFEERLDHALHDFDQRALGRNYSPRIILAYLPQPPIPENLALMEGDFDQIFSRLCAERLGVLREGYRLHSSQTWVGLSSDSLQYGVFEDGLRLIITSPIRDQDSPLGYFIAPEKLRITARASLKFLPTSAGFFGLRLVSMGQAFVANDPKTNSLLMRSFFGSEDDYAVAEYFNPMSPGAFDAWLERIMGSIERRYGYPPRSS